MVQRLATARRHLRAIEAKIAYFQAAMSLVMPRETGMSIVEIREVAEIFPGYKRAPEQYAW